MSGQCGGILDSRRPCFSSESIPRFYDLIKNEVPLELRIVHSDFLRLTLPQLVNRRNSFSAKHSAPVSEL